MSKQVDERVVSMQFDNKHFERNVSTTMSTLDKLKQKLNFSGASKGLENVGTAAKNVNMSGLGNAVESVRTKFSALEVMGVTALANITNSAVNAGKRIVSALTIDPVKTGFQEYETQINAVQTIMANVAHKGKTLDDVNKALDELNEYADLTIYNFTEMTRNIGLFTNAGVDLDVSVASIKGFSNAAAMAGTESTKASMAMYQLSQAMSSGSVKLQDWKSLETANITGERFVDTIKETAKAHGIAVDDMIAKEGTFRETLKSGWLTADLMAEALGHYTLSTETMTKEEQKANRERLKSIGYTEEQIDKLFALGTEATGAATKVKTFTQMWGVLQETAQSGWSKTWQLIFGDFEQAKSLFTPMTKFFSGIIDNISDFRNNILKGALGSPSSNAWEKFSDKIKETGISIEDFQAKLKETASEHGISLDDLISEYGSLQKAIGSGKISTEMIIETIKKFSKVTEGSTEALKEEDKYIVKKGDNLTKIARKYGTTWREIYELNKDQIKDPNLIFPEQIFKLPDAQLKSIGYTEEQIKAIRELGEQAEKTGTPINELIEDLAEMEKPSGRDLLIDTFKNLKDTVMGVASAIKEAWQNIFPPKTIEERSAKLYGLIEGLNEFSKKLKVDDDVAKKLKRTFKGLFAILDIIKTVVGGPLSIAFKLISQLLSAFNLNILDVTAVIGDVVVKFRDWIKSTLDFTEIFKTIVPHVKNAIKVIKEWVSAIKDSDFYKAGKNILEGLINGLKNGAQNVWDFIVNIAEQLIEKFKNVLGIHSPSKVFFAIGGFIISGLLLGITNAFPKVGETIKEKFNGIIEFLKGIDWGAIFSGGAIVGSLLIGNKMANALEGFSAPFEGLGEVFSGVGNVLNKSAKGIGKILKNTAKVVKSFSKVMNSISFNIKAKAIKDLSVSLLLLVGAIVVLTFIEPDKLWTAVEVVGALAAVLIALTLATEKMSKASVSIGKDGAKMNGFKNGIISMAASLLLVALAVKMIGSMDPEEAKQGFLGLAAVVIAMGILAKAFGKMTKYKGSGDIDKVGKMILKISAAMLLMVIVIKLISGMDAKALFKGLIVVTYFGLIISGLIASTKLAGKDIDNIGSTILKISAAMILLAIVLKMVSGIDAESLENGLLGIIKLAGIVAGLILITRLAGNQINNIGSTIIKISAAMLLMVFVMKLVSGMDTGDLRKGIIVITIFASIISGLIFATKLAGNDVAKIGSTILMISVAVGVLALVATLLGFLRLEHLAKGITAVGILSVMMALMINATRGAQDCMKNLIVIAVAIGLMAAAVAGLSFIDPERLAYATAGLSMVMSAFALMITASKSFGNAKGLIGTMTVLLSVVVVLAGVITALSLLDANSALENTAAISLLLISMAASMLILSKTDKISMKAIGALAIIGLVVGELALILSIMSSFDISASIETALSLSILLIGMSAACLIVSAVPLVGAVKGALGLVAFVGIMAALLAALGGLSKIPGFNELIIDGGKTLGLIGYAIGNFVGSIIGGLSAGITSGLPQIGANLTAFMQNVSGFIEGAKNIDPSIIKGVGALGAAILVLGASQLVEGLADLILWCPSLPDLGTQLSMFMANAMPFITSAMTIKPEMVEGIRAFANAILILTAANLIDGIASFIGGGSSLEDFGSQLVLLGKGLKGFSDELNGFTDEQLNTVNCAAKAVKTLAEASAAIPNTGGLLANIVGDNDLGIFAGQFPKLGTGLADFLTNIGTFTDEQVATVNCAANAIKLLAEASSAIPNTGGLLAQIVGDNDLGTFANQFPILGTGLAKFLTNVGTFTDEQVATVDCAARSIKLLAEASSQIPNSGGWLAQIVGDNDLGTFAEQFPKLGTGLRGFLDNVGTFTDEQVATVNCGAGAVKTLAEVASGIPNEGGWLAKIVGDNNLGTFASNFPLVGEGLKGFADKLGTFGSDQLSTINTGIRAVKAITELSKVDLSSFSSKIGDFGTKLVSFGEKLSTFCGNLSTYNKFKSAGSYLVDGFAEGISSNTFKAEAKAKAMAEAALQAAKEALDINSPSKVFRKLGTFIPEGFAMGIDKLGYMVKDSSVSMARTAIDGTKNAISSIANAINNDIDSQPTIRPVLDLTDVRNGASTIGSMLNRELLSVDTSSVGAISSMMNRRQNGSNDDVISAIKDLGKTIGNGSGNTYTINGITYDDGSAVSDAIQTLVRATRIERRT